MGTRTTIPVRPVGARTRAPVIPLWGELYGWTDDDQAPPKGRERFRLSAYTADRKPLYTEELHVELGS